MSNHTPGGICNRCIPCDITVRRVPKPFRHRGFTLVELIVVVGVIGLLIGLLLPALRRAREAGQQVVCTSNLRQWSAAAMMYANLENGWLPRRGQGAQPTSVINRPEDWFNALPAVMRAASYRDLVNGNKTPRPGDGSIWMCPAVPSGAEMGKTYFFAYAMNMRMSTWQSPTPDRVTRIGSWSTVVFMSEGSGSYCSVLPAGADYSPVARHRGRVNVGFLDGHVASYTGQEVGCGVGDPQRPDVRWTIPYSTWAGPGGGGGGSGSGGGGG